MVEPYHIKLAPHNPNGPVATAASLHVSATTQNSRHPDILEPAAETDRNALPLRFFAQRFMQNAPLDGIPVRFPGRLHELSIPLR